MNNSDTYFHNFESIDKTKNLFFLLQGRAWIIDWFRAIRLPDSEYNKPLIIDLPGHG